MCLQRTFTCLERSPYARARDLVARTYIHTMRGSHVRSRTAVYTCGVAHVPCLSELPE